MTISLSWPTVKAIAKLVPVVLLVLVLVLLLQPEEENNRAKKSLINNLNLPNCDPDDAICRHCPFFREHMFKMLTCITKKIDAAMSADEIETLEKGLLTSVKSCNLNWLRGQRVVQLIRVRKTMLTITPANKHAPVTALVIGKDKDFTVERQVSLNITTTKFYGVNLGNNDTAELFKHTLGGVVLTEDINLNPENTESDSMIADHFFGKYFPQRPVDVVFLNEPASTALVSQLMGHGTHGLQSPICQLNFHMPFPQAVSDARAFLRWFRGIATATQPYKTQFVVGHAALFGSGKDRILRVFAVNVGHPICATRFLQRNECRSLIATEFDE